MIRYLQKRLLLFPVTLFCILGINFFIINLAPGEPSSFTAVGGQGTVQQENVSPGSASDFLYLQFREHYGLTLPIFLNTWFLLSKQTIDAKLERIYNFVTGKEGKQSFSDYQKERLLLGDQAKYTLPLLLESLEQSQDPLLDQIISSFIVRGGTRQANISTSLTSEEKQKNTLLAEENQQLAALKLSLGDSQEERASKKKKLRAWLTRNKEAFSYEQHWTHLLSVALTETRFYRFFSRVLTLDFGTLRNDSNKRVIDEVVQRFPISLTLAAFPLLFSFVLCILFGFIMAYFHRQPLDRGLNLLFLFLYALPVFVAAPFFIENIALNHTFPFTDIPIPTHGFTSQQRLFSQMTTWEKLLDVLRHISIPLLAILYSSFATYSRLVRSVCLDVLQLDYIRTAYAKGLSSWTVAWKHVGRNISIVLLTALAGSLGVLLGGSLIVETLFEINGFGKFFYDGIVNRDFNVIMFSALAGSFLTLIGYFLADLFYVTLDPRVRFE